MACQHDGKPFAVHHINQVLQKKVIPDGCLKAYPKSLCTGEDLKRLRFTTMGSGVSQHDEEDEYPGFFYSPRGASNRKSPNRPMDTKSTIIKVEKTKKDLRVRKEKEINEQNGFTPFTPRGTIGYQSSNQRGGNNQAPTDGTLMGSKSKAASKKGKRSKGPSSKGMGVSFYSKNVYVSDEDLCDLSGAEDDGLTGKEKVESYLRRSRVPETKVRNLAVRIWEQAMIEMQKQYDKLQQDTSALRKSLLKTIHQPLDLMLYGKTHKTSLNKAEDNLEEVVCKVSELVELLEVDMALCLDGVNKHLTGKKGNKSVPLLVRDAVLALEADYDILYEKYHDLRREKDEAIQQQTKTKTKSDALEETSVVMEREYKKLIEQVKDMSLYIHELKDQRRQLKNSQQHLLEDNARLKKQVQWYQESNAIVHKDLMKLQETCAQLQVQSTQQAKEIRRLKDPDKEMLYKINRLETELTEAKTANRKLELEKGSVKTSLTKLQAHYDGLQRERGTLVKQRQKLEKENEKIKTTNKKLKLSS